MKLSSVCLLMLSFTLMGCELLNEKVVTVKPAVTLQTDEHFDNILSDLIEQITQVEQFNYQQKSVAFTTFVWMDTLTLKNDKRTNVQLGHQISSSLKTELVQQGGKVVEHKSAKAISMSNNASYYLTRKLNDLSQNVEVSYVLTGTMLEIKGGVAVNIEVIDIDSHIVVSSARTFISNEYLPELNSTFLKEGKIYRVQL
jgi:TolB-like protein